MIRQPVDSIRIIGRNTQGVRLLRLDDGATISSVTKVIKDDDETGTEDIAAVEDADTNVFDGKTTPGPQELDAVPDAATAGYN